MNDPFTNAMTQLNRAAQMMNLDERVHERLRYPEKLHVVSIPIIMDSGDERIFMGYRSQYSSARGPYKGGIRFSEGVNESEVKALSFWMAIKTATVGLPLGGGKGGVTVDPRSLSENELERLSRGWVKALFNNLGPTVDIPAPDVATNPKVMGWMVDEYSTMAGTLTPAAFTGKDVSDGGIVARGTSTARGGFYLLEEMKHKLEKDAQDTTVAVQGFGNAGGVFAKLAYDAGYKIVGISDSRNSVWCARGLNPHDLDIYKKKQGTFKGFQCDGARVTDNSRDILEAQCDVLVPAAIENQITVDNVADIKAKIIIELANGPTTPEADIILEERNILVVPDVLANAGGVIVSHFEWEQNMSDEVWSEEDTNKKLHKMIISAYADITQHAEKYNTSMRTAAFINALDCITEAM